MRIDDLTRLKSGSSPASLKEVVLEYLENHSEEVFSYRDEELAKALKVNQSALGFTLWSLHEKHLIDKAFIEGKVYFGSQAAIRRLREKLRDESDPLERARLNRQRIFERVGYIDNAQLLEDVREGRWD